MTIANQIISFKLSGINYTGTSTQLNYTSGVTQGICIASKALVVDENKNISGINEVSATSIVSSILTGTLQTTSQPNITNLGVLTSLNVSGNVNIQGHNSSSIGLQLNGSLVTANATELNYLALSTPGIAVAGKAVVLNSSRNISNINSITSSDLIVSNNFSYKGTQVTASGEKINYVDVSPGVAENNKAIILNSSKEIIGINSLTSANVVATNLTGTIQTASQPQITHIGTLTNLTMAGNISNAVNITMSGSLTGATNVSATNLTGILQTAVQSQITQVGTLTNLAVSGRTTTATATIGTLTLGNTVLDSSASDLNKLTNVSNGTASADKALVVNSSRDLGNLNNVVCSSITAGSISGSISTASQVNINQLGVLNGLEVISAPVVRIVNNSSNQSNAQTWTNNITGPITTKIEMDNASVRFGTLTNHTLRLIANNNNVMSIENTGNVSIGTTVTSAYRLNVAGGLNSSTLFLNNSQINSTATELNYLSAVTPGSILAGKAIVVDSNRNITNLASIGCTSVTADSLTGVIQTPVQTNITQVGEMNSLSFNSTGVSVFIRNQNSTSAAAFRLQNDIRNIEIGLRGSTAGTNTNCLYILDSSNTRLIMDSSGNICIGGNTNTGNHRLNVIGSLNSSSLFINGSQINSTPLEINLLSGITPGTAGAGKVLAVDSNRDITNIRNIQATGTISGVLQTSQQPQITQVGTLSSLSMSGDISGVSNISLNGTITGATSISATNLTGSIQTPTQTNITQVGVLNSITTSGNVKVGTISSAASDMLHVEGNNSNGLGIQIENRNTTSNSTSYLKFTGYSSSNDNYDLAGIACGYVTANANFGYGYLSFSTRNNSTALAASERMRITQDGSVGIGKTSPLYTLDVDGSINGSEYRMNGNLIAATAWELNRLASITAGTATPVSALVTDSSVSISGINSLSATSLSGTLTTGNQPNITNVGTLNGLTVSTNIANFNAGMYLIGNFNSAGSNMAGFNSISASSLTGTLQTGSQTNITTVGTLTNLAVTGVVKMGTAVNPAQDLLHVEGNSTTTVGIQLDNMNTTSNSGTHIKFNGYSNSNTNYDLARITCGYVAASSSFGYGYLSFSTRNNSSNSMSSERMRITQDGLVGIGNTNPSYNLDIAGVARAYRLLIGDSTNNSSNRAISALNVNMTSSDDYFICIGQSNSAKNQAEVSFVYNGYGSASNAMRLGLHSSDKISINGNGYLGCKVNNPSNNVHINQEGTNTCLRIDYYGNNSIYTDLGVSAYGRLYVSNGMLIGSSNSDPSSAYVNITGMTTTAVTNYGYVTSSGVVGSNGSSGNFGCSLRTTGRIVCGTELNVLSDKRLKKNIESVDDKYCKDFVYEVDAKKYVYKKDKDNKPVVGFIAQDIIKSGFKEIIGFSQEEVEEVVDDDGFLNPKGQVFTVNYEAIVPILSRNVKNLFEENRELKEEIAELKKTLMDIQNKLSS